MDAETFDLFRTTVRRFVSEKLIPAEDAVEEADAVPETIIQQMRDMGIRPSGGVRIDPRPWINNPQLKVETAGRITSEHGSSTPPLKLRRDAWWWD